LNFEIAIIVDQILTSKVVICLLHLYDYLL